jgi:hypothetical protein
MRKGRADTLMPAGPDRTLFLTHSMDFCFDVAADLPYIDSDNAVKNDIQVTGFIPS